MKSGRADACDILSRIRFSRLYSAKVGQLLSSLLQDICHNSTESIYTTEAT